MGQVTTLTRAWVQVLPSSVRHGRSVLLPAVAAFGASVLGPTLINGAALAICETLGIGCWGCAVGGWFAGKLADRLFAAVLSCSAAPRPRDPGHDWWCQVPGLAGMYWAWATRIRAGVIASVSTRHAVSYAILPASSPSASCACVAALGPGGDVHVCCRGGGACRPGRPARRSDVRRPSRR